MTAAPVPELPATGGVGDGVAYGLGLIGYGLLALGGARLVGRRAR